MLPLDVPRDRIRGVVLARKDDYFLMGSMQFTLR